jgi:hypothetical protein
MNVPRWICIAGVGVLLLGANSDHLATPAGIAVKPPSNKADATRQWVHPFDLPQTSSFPDEVLAVIEIPQGSFTKYEIDPESGYVAVDRFQSMPVVYPANYGVITSSLAGDGDNLDVLVLSREPIVPGAIVRVFSRSPRAKSPKGYTPALQADNESDCSDTDVASDLKYPPKCCNRCQAQLDPGDCSGSLRRSSFLCSGSLRRSYFAN